MASAWMMGPARTQRMVVVCALLIIGVSMLETVTAGQVAATKHRRRLHQGTPRSPSQSRVPRASPPSPVLPPGDQCHTDPNNDYQGTILAWGADNLQPSAAACCANCTALRGCNIWVWCGKTEGCGGGRAYKECWLKYNTLDYITTNYGKGNPGIPWTAGAVYTQAELTTYRNFQAELAANNTRRLNALRDDPELPLAFFDVAINGTPAGRIEFVLFAKDSPRQAENLRSLITGERGLDPSGQPYSIRNQTFYRIITNFLIQTGPRRGQNSIFGGVFLDDIGGLLLNHDRKGLMGAATSGPNTNNGDFAFAMGPNPSATGNYPVIGEVVSGIEVVDKVNALAATAPNNELLFSPAPVITNAGILRNGTYIQSKEYQDIIASEFARIKYNQAMNQTDLARYTALWTDTTKPLTFLEVAINGTYVGRISIVLFPEQTPIAAENFRLLTTGEAGFAPPGHEGAGLPYSFANASFYSVLGNYLAQAGAQTDSPLGGYFQNDDVYFRHDRKGLLSQANRGNGTNGAHFDIMLGPAPGLDGQYIVFGEVVDGYHVLEAINKVAMDRPDDQYSGTDIRIIQSGQLRPGSYIQTQEYQDIIAAEKARIASTFKPFQGKRRFYK